MIAVGADPQDLQLNSSLATFPLHLGNELPSQTCDLGDLNISQSDIDLFLLQSLSDVAPPEDAHANANFGASEGNHYVPTANVCDLSFLLEDKRPRDLNLSFPGECNSVLLQSPSSPCLSAGMPEHVNSTIITTVPQSHSRAASPAWSERSESSGSMSTSSVSGPSVNKDRHGCGNSLMPRHKRPSHKRAETKRRDKIKSCLDDLKEHVPSLRNKGKMSESAILFKAAEFIHQLKDGNTENGCKTEELRQEIHCLSAEIHSFQESLPAGGLKEEAISGLSLDEMYQQWVTAQSQKSTKFYIFSTIMPKLFESFKEIVGPATNFSTLAARVKEWQEKHLSLPVLRKQVFNGMLSLTRKTSILSFPEILKSEPKSVDRNS